MGTSRSLSADLSRFGQVVDKRMTAVVRQAGLTLLEEVQRDNPVKSGWSRASWQLLVNDSRKGVWSMLSRSWVPYAAPLPRGLRPPRTAAIDIPVRPKIPAITWRDTMYVTNGTPYIGILEERDGFVARAIARATRKIKKHAKEIAR